ncbi:MAG: hypothetical protein HY270_20260 [Deltaproteobacteria bacterium]|nr:hypothetical protein [Deltaproteobacteria bacterium]
MKRIGIGAATLTLLLSFCALRRAHATVADDLCAPTDDPCVIATKVTVDPSSTLDFGTRALRILKSGVLTWSTSLTLTAGNCDFQPQSKVAEAKTSPGTDFLWMNCSSSTLAGTIRTVGGGVLVEGPGPHLLSGVIRAVGDNVGVIAVDSAGLPGGITVSGKIVAKANKGTPPGEFRLISNFGDVLITDTARISATGVTTEPNSLLWFEAGSGKLTIQGRVTAKASSGAYDLNLEGNGDVVLGPKSRISAPAKKVGAGIGINSQGGRVGLQGSIVAPVRQVQSGSGARVRVCASSDILIDGGAKIDASDGNSNGSIIVNGGGTTSVGTNLQGAKVLAKTDGDIEICGATLPVVSTKSTIKPPPQELGTNECLSANSQFIFFLDCNH